VDSVDDLGVIDPTQIRRRDPEVCVTELARGCRNIAREPKAWERWLALAGVLWDEGRNIVRIARYLGRDPIG
jgi:hypothetical protein